MKALSKAAGKGDSFEALYETKGLQRSSLSRWLILAAPRSAANPWTSQTDRHFPAG